MPGPYWLLSWVAVFGWRNTVVVLARPSMITLARGSVTPVR